MPSPTHAASWHLLDSSFPDCNRGLSPPPRALNAGPATLRIANLDRSDPPGYRAGDYPRGSFNRNQFMLGPDPAMPVIRVECAAAGFDPAVTPIEWRLVCRHVLCRHINAGGYRYRGAACAFEREWRGASRSASFAMFSATADGACTYNGAGCVMGGHGLLMVAVKLPQATLHDYVHVRVAGANPSPPEVLRYLDGRLAGYDLNVACMVRAVFRHESNFRQFADQAQTSALMRFTRVHHGGTGQPDCRVRFDWPDDPPGFPLASFDFGVGIAQWTHAGTQRVTADIAWDWRENVRLGANHLLAALSRSLQPGMNWRQAARAAWTLYNGSGAAAAAYAARLAASPDGLSIAPAPAALSAVALFPPPPAVPDPAPWVYA